MKKRFVQVIHVMALLVLCFICCGKAGKKDLPEVNNSYFTQDVYDNLTEMRFGIAGGELTEVIQDEEQMYVIFSFLAGLRESSSGNQELLYGGILFDFVMKNGDIYSYTNAARNFTYCPNHIPETEENYEEAAPVNAKNTKTFYTDCDEADQQLYELVWDWNTDN